MRISDWSSDWGSGVCSSDLHLALEQWMHDNVNTGSFVIFEWDDDKAAANLRKHHVAFELAELVWDDPAHIIVFDRYENDEERWHAIGLVRGILILTALLQTLTRFPRLGSCTVKIGRAHV